MPYLVAVLLRNGALDATLEQKMLGNVETEWASIVQFLVSLPDVVMPLISQADASLPNRLRAELGLISKSAAADAPWWQILTPGSYFPLLSTSLVGSLLHSTRSGLRDTISGASSTSEEHVARASRLCRRLVALGHAGDLLAAAFTSCFDEIMFAVAAAGTEADASESLSTAICTARVVLAAVLTILSSAATRTAALDGKDVVSGDSSGSLLPQLARQLLGLVAQACEEPVAAAGPSCWTALLAFCMMERALLFPQLACEGNSSLVQRLQRLPAAHSIVGHELRVATLLRCLLGPAAALQLLQQPIGGTVLSPFLCALTEARPASGDAGSGQTVSLQPWLLPSAAASSSDSRLQLLCRTSVVRMAAPSGGQPLWLVGMSQQGELPAAAALAQAMLVDVLPSKRIRGTVARGFLDFFLWDVLPAPVACDATSGIADGPLSPLASASGAPAASTSTADAADAAGPLLDSTAAVQRPCVWTVLRSAACASDATCPSAVVAALVQLLSPTNTPAPAAAASTSSPAVESSAGATPPASPPLVSGWTALLRPDAATDELLGADVRSTIAGLSPAERPDATSVASTSQSGSVAAGYTSLSYVLPLQELAARWASPHYAAAAESGVQASFGRVLTHLLHRLPPVVLAGAKVRLGIPIPLADASGGRTRVVKAALPPPLPLLLPTLTTGVSVRMDHASTAVRGGALRVARSFSVAMTTQVKLVRYGRDAAAAASSATATAAEHDEHDEEDGPDLDAPEPGLPTLAPLSFAGDEDVKDEEDEAEAEAQDALDAQAALVLAGLSAPAAVSFKAAPSSAGRIAESAGAAAVSGTAASYTLAPTGDGGNATAATAASGGSTATAAVAADVRKPFVPPRLSVQSYVATGRAVMRVPTTAAAAAISASAAATAAAAERAAESAIMPVSSASGVTGQVAVHGAAAAHAALTLERARAAAAAAEDDAAADSPFLRRALQLAARAPTDLFGTTARLARARFGGAGAPSGAAALQLAAGGSAGGAGAAASSAIMLSAGDDGGAVSLLDTLRSESDHEGAAAALVALPRLVRASAADPRQREALVSAAPSLLRALLSLDDRFGLPDFGLWRFTALTSLAAVSLPLAAPHLLRTMFAAGELSEGVRLEALDVLVAAAREVAGADPPVIPEAPWELAMRLWRAARVQRAGQLHGHGRAHSQLMPMGDVASNDGDGDAGDGFSGNSRALTTSPAGSAAAQGGAPARPNRLAGLAADALFYPLLRGILTGSPAPSTRSSGGGGGAPQIDADTPTGHGTGAATVDVDVASLLDDVAGVGTGLSDTAEAFAFARSPRMLADGSSALLLAQSLRTLAVLLELTRVHASAEGMARSLLALAWGVREHVDAGVRRACLSACAAVIATVWTNATLAQPSVLFVPGSAAAASASAAADGLAAGSAGADVAGGSSLSPAVACLLPAHLRMGYEQAAAARTEMLLKASRPRAQTVGACTAPAASSNLAATGDASGLAPAPAAAVPGSSTALPPRRPMIVEVSGAVPGSSAASPPRRPMIVEVSAGAGEPSSGADAVLDADEDEEGGQCFTRSSPVKRAATSAAAASASPRGHAFVTVVDVSADAATGSAAATAAPMLPAAGANPSADSTDELAAISSGEGRRGAASVLGSLTSVARRLERSAQLTALLTTGGSVGVSGRIKGGTDRGLAEQAAASLLRKAGLVSASAAQSAARTLEEAASEALLKSLVSGGAAPTMWDDLQEVVAHLCAVETGDPDADNRALASALLNNEITRTLVMRPLQLLDDIATGNKA